MSTSKQRSLTSTDKQRTLISFVTHSKSSPIATQIKRNNSNLSPPESEPIHKKANISENRKDITEAQPITNHLMETSSNGITVRKLEENNDTDQTSYSTTNSSNTVTTELVGNIVEPLILEMRLLKESVHDGYSKLEDIISNQQATIAKLETSITTQQTELNKDISERIEESNTKIKDCLEQNHQLWKENTRLKERLNKIEINQLSNNVIITGVQEQPWEGYGTTKERVIEIIAKTMEEIKWKML